VFYLFGDHLGSSSLVVDWQGRKISEMRYAPWGETRWAWELDGGRSYSDRKFTSQREEASSYVGTLYDYGARFYLPYAARFVSPDSIVPNARNPLDFNRYAYVRSNPLKQVDSSGHLIDTLFDIAAVGVSIVELYNNPSDPLNYVALALDLTAAVIPFVPAGAGLVIRAANTVRKADKAIDAAQFAAKAKKILEGAEFFTDIVQDVSQDVQIDRFTAAAGNEPFQLSDSLLGNGMSAIFSAGIKKIGGKALGTIPAAILGGLGNLGSSALISAKNEDFDNEPSLPHSSFASATGSIFGTLGAAIGGKYDDVSTNPLKFEPSMGRALGRNFKMLAAMGMFGLTHAVSKPKPVNLNFEKRQ
jgi:RHS repeat-associated protein